MSSQPRQSSRTLLWGLLFGVILAILVVIERLFEGRLARAAGLGAVRPGLALFSPAIVFVVGLVAFFVAGLLAAHRTRQLSSGLAAGLIAGVIVGVVWLVLALHTTGAAEQVTRTLRAPRLRALAQAAIVGAVVRSILAAVMIALAGAGVGALGGLAGRGDATPAPPSGAQPYVPDGFGAAAGTSEPVSAYPPRTPSYPQVTPGSSLDQHRYGPATPPTYIQGNDNPTVQMPLQE